MKKLNLLAKTEMKKIMGGIEEFGDKCNVKYTSPKLDFAAYMPQYFNGSCVDQQVQAQIYCINFLAGRNESGDHCYYDCACDGVNPNF